MTDSQDGVHPRIPQTIRTVSVPLLLFILALTVVTNVVLLWPETFCDERATLLAPQRRVVAAGHPTRQRDSNGAMIVSSLRRFRPSVAGLAFP